MDFFFSSFGGPIGDDILLHACDGYCTQFQLDFLNIFLEHLYNSDIIELKFIDLFWGKHFAVLEANLYIEKNTLLILCRSMTRICLKIFDIIMRFTKQV